MLFASPLWLLALIPWSAAAVSLFRGRRPTRAVPFLLLWISDRGAAPRSNAKWQTPPPSLIAALLAALCCLLAAAGPSLAVRRGTEEVTVVIDRGVTMSARAGRMPRFVAAAKALDRALRDRRTIRLKWVSLPPGPSGETTGGRLADALAALPRTAIDVRDSIREATRTAAHDRPAAALVLLSDAPAADAAPIGGSPQPFQISPGAPLEDVGIDAVASRATPRPAVLVTVANRSAHTAATLTVASGREQRSVSIALPPRGGRRDYDVALPAVGETVEARLDVGGDDCDADDVARLTLAGPDPRIETRGPLDAPARRAIDVYRQLRPADPTGTMVLVSAAEPGDGDAAGATVSVPQDGGAAALAAGATTYAFDTPLARGVLRWPTSEPDTVVSEPPPGHGWQPVVVAGGRPLVATRDGPPRAVWVGVRSARWAATSDFVVFWSNVLDWAGQARRDYESRPTGDLPRSYAPATALPADVDREPPGRWPGLYSDRGGGPFAAVNCPPLRDIGDAPDDSEALRKALDERAAASLPLAPTLLWAAWALLAASVAMRSRRAGDGRSSPAAMDAPRGKVR